MIESGKPVQDISITKESSIEKIFEQMSKSGGFESRNLAESFDI
jgi:deoxyhypusine synthase